MHRSVKTKTSRVIKHLRARNGFILDFTRPTVQPLSLMDSSPRPLRIAARAALAMWEVLVRLWLRTHSHDQAIAAQELLVIAFGMLPGKERASIAYLLSRSFTADGRVVGRSRSALTKALRERINEATNAATDNTLTAQ